MKYGLMHNESGFVVESENVDGFVKVVEILILDPHLKVEMGKSGRVFVERNYDNDILGAKLLAIYKTTLYK